MESSAEEAVGAAAAAESSSAAAQVSQAGSCAPARRGLASRVRGLVLCWVVQTQRAAVSVQAAGVGVSSSAGQPCSTSWAQ